MNTKTKDSASTPNARHDAAECARQMARDKFLCAESVFTSLVRAKGWEVKRPAALATGFCSGMARTRGQCGALSGAVLALGYGLGRTSPDESLDPCHAAVEELVEEFRERFGGRDCLDIVGYDIADPKGLQEFREAGVWAGLCEDVIAFAVMRALDLLEVADD